MDWNSLVLGALTVFGLLFGFVFMAVGISTVYVFARIGLDNVQKQWSSAKEADQALNDAVRQAEKDWGSRR